MKRIAIAFAIAVATSSMTVLAVARPTPPPPASTPLNLALPPDDALPSPNVPAPGVMASRTRADTPKPTASAVRATARTMPDSAPGVYYGDTSDPPQRASAKRTDPPPPASSAPGAYYGDTSGPPAGTSANRSDPPPATSATSLPDSPPGVYYGDTSGRVYRAPTRMAATRRCDDSTYTKPEVHGSVGMGVMGGNRFSGNYETGTINVTKNLGSCDHPTGGFRFSISVGQGRFGGHRW